MVDLNAATRARLSALRAAERRAELRIRAPGGSPGRDSWEQSQLLQGDRYTPRRIRVRDAQGEWRWLAIIAADLLDDPDVGSIVVHSWDITDEVAREEEIDASRRLLASLIDTLDEGVVVVSEGTVAFANAKISQFFPAVGDPQQLIGRPPEEMHDAFAQRMADPEAFVESAWRLVSAGEAVRGRYVETADGRIFEQNFLPDPCRRAADEPDVGVPRRDRAAAARAAAEAAA